MSNRYFHSKVKHICNLPVDMPKNGELFFTIDALDEAIEQKRQVEFEYCDYGTDRALHPRLNSEEQPRKHLINPYQMVATNGRYYLIANYEKYDNISHYKVDKIRNINPALPHHASGGTAEALAESIASGSAYCFVQSGYYRS